MSEARLVLVAGPPDGASAPQAPEPNLADPAIEKPNAEPRELADGLRSGDARSYEELVRRYGGKMLRVATHIVGNREDGRECVQEAFLQAFKNIDRFEGRSSLWTWLHRIVVNSALLKLRTRRRRPEGAIDDLMPEFDAYRCRIEASAKKEDSIETLLDRKEIRNTVRRAIDELPEDYRSVLILRDIEELDTEETASMLGIKRGAVKTRLHRARSALKKLLEPVICEAP